MKALNESMRNKHLYMSLQKQRNINFVLENLSLGFPVYHRGAEHIKVSFIISGEINVCIQLELEYQITIQSI